MRTWWLQSLLMILMASRVGVAGPPEVKTFDIVPYDSATMSFTTSESQALQYATTWSKNPSIQLQNKGVDVTFGNGESEAEYVFETADGTQTFRCSCKTGDVIFWKDGASFGSAYSNSINCRNVDVTNLLPVSELDTLERQFLSSRCAKFSSLNMQLSAPYAGGEYCQQFPNGVWYAGNHIRVDVNEATGQVVRYESEFCDVPSVAVDYSVSALSAEGAAVSYLTSLNLAESGEDPVYAQSVFIWRNYGVWLMKNPSDQYVVAWMVDAVAEEDTGFTKSAFEYDLKEHSGSDRDIRTIYIDARTGSIVKQEKNSGVRYDPPSAATPVFDLAEGTHTGTQTLTITCPTGDSTIRYTLDGTNPTKDSTLYEAPITVDHTLTVKSRAFASKCRSSLVKSASYVIE